MGVFAISFELALTLELVAVFTGVFTIFTGILTGVLGGIFTGIFSGVLACILPGVLAETRLEIRPVNVVHRFLLADSLGETFARFAVELTVQQSCQRKLLIFGMRWRRSFREGGNQK